MWHLCCFFQCFCRKFKWKIPLSANKLCISESMSVFFTQIVDDHSVILRVGSVFPTCNFDNHPIIFCKYFICLVNKISVSWLLLPEMTTSWFFVFSINSNKLWFWSSDYFNHFTFRRFLLPLRRCTWTRSPFWADFNFVCCDENISV